MLDQILPGKAIGGDVYKNQNQQLPANAQYREIDINYEGGNRNGQRLVITSGCLVKNDVYSTFFKFLSHFFRKLLGNFRKDEDKKNCEDCLMYFTSDHYNSFNELKY